MTLPDGWPRTRLGEAAAALARSTGRSRWELVPFTADLAEVDATLLACGPALVELPDRVLAVVGGQGGVLRCLGPDLRADVVAVEEVAVALAAGAAAEAGRALAPTLTVLGATPDDPVGQAALREALSRRAVAVGLQLRTPADAPVAALAADAGLFRLVGRLGAVMLAQAALGVTAWLVGAGAALEGRLDRDALVAWGLLAGSGIPLALAGAWWRGELALRAGLVVRRRLLAGIARLPDAGIRRDGAGDALTRLMDAGEVQQLAVGAGLGAVGAAFDLALAAGVVAAGPLGAVGVGWLGVVGLAVAALGALQHARGRAVRAARLDVTRGLIARLAGHTTRQVQQATAHWHDEDDAEAAAVLAGQRRLDAAVLAAGAVPSAFVLGALAALAPAVAAGDQPAVLAVGLAGVLLSAGAFTRLVDGVDDLIAAALAAERVAPLWRAATEVPLPGDPGVAWSLRAPASTGEVVLEVVGATVVRAGRVTPALRDVRLAVRAGERVLVEGPSGAGKSTLVGLLTGALRPTAGLVLLRGMDLPAVGTDAWRRSVGVAPQFHENHLFQGSLLFNLLLGVGWPATPEDEGRAVDLCERLGLGPLLRRMPSGVHQQVGETGWQLSHGERSRVYLARALLQGRDVVVLDESFAALDPETLRVCVEVAREVAPTLIVVAHP